MPVLDPGGVSKDCDFHKVATLSTGIEEMDALSLWLSKFVMEVAKKTGELCNQKNLIKWKCLISDEKHVSSQMKTWWCFIGYQDSST